MIINGIHYKILWAEFKPGTSIFLPAVDVKPVVYAIRKESTRLGFDCVHKVVIENGIRGVRVWRL